MVMVSVEKPEDLTANLSLTRARYYPAREEVSLEVTVMVECGEKQASKQVTITTGSDIENIQKEISKRREAVYSTLEKYQEKIKSLLVLTSQVDVELEEIAEKLGEACK
jgi:hypothetical protein